MCMRGTGRPAGFILALMMTFAMTGASFAQVAVRFNGYTIDVKGREPAVPKGLEATRDGRYKKWIVQLAGPVIEEQKKHLAALGCRLGDYLPDFAFIVTMDDRTRKDVEGLPFINGVVRYKPAYKIDRRLKSEKGEVKAEKGSAARLHIRVDGADNLPIVLAEVLKKKGRVLHVGYDVTEVEIQRMDIPRMAQIEEVVWIEEAPVLQIMNDSTAWVVQSNVINDTRIWSKGLHGEGQIIGVADTGLDYDMPWFRDPAGTAIGPEHRKIVGYDTSYGDDYDADNPGHGTHVAGTLGGDRTPVDGLANANGVAPKSRLYIQDITPGSDIHVNPPADLGDLFLSSYTAGARIHTNSWGSMDNSYTTYSLTADRFLWEHKDFLALFSNGNAGPETYTVGSPATAKNVISVGAALNGTADGNIASFSGNGPTTDGRIKPTVTAPGDGTAEGSGVISADSDGVKNSNNSGTIFMRGTSSATPAVAGAAALARQYFTDGYYPTGASNPSDVFSPSAALVKAMIVNSAENMSGNYTDGPIPSTGQGWGRVNLANTLFFQGDPAKLSVVDNAAGLATGQNWSQLYYSAADQPLKITLAWTDFPGAEGAAKALVNDLDIFVTAPDGTTNYLGNVFANGESAPGGSADRLNVEEQVLIQNPVTGAYTITVSAYNVPFGPQPFAVVVTGASSVTSKGSIVFNKTTYSGSNVAGITVTDRDLNVNSGAADEVFVTVSSTTEPAGEQVRLTETGPNMAIFTGTIPLSMQSPVPGNGISEVSNGDTLTAVYQDADNGSGNPATVTATSMIDTVPPVISSVTATDISDLSATVSWSTNEGADAVVNYGVTTSLGASRSDPFQKTQHSIALSVLQEAKTYYYEVRSTDAAGNLAVENNNGSFHTFTTIGVPPSLTVYSSNGSETYLEETVIFGVSSDPSGVESVKVNGTAAAYRASDGYYELSLPLSYGDNAVSVSATDMLGNVKTLSMSIYRLLPPDLISAMTTTANGATGGTVSITDTVTNIGTGNAKSFAVGFYISTDNVITTTDRLLNTRTVQSLAAGEVSTATTAVGIPASLTPGTYYIGVIADPDNVQYESNEDNNSSQGSVIDLEGPDLQFPIPPLAFEQALVTGGTLTILNTVKNNAATASASAFTVGLYLSTDQEITTGDIYLASREVTAGLSPGQSSFDVTVVTIPKYIAGGSYYIGAIADISQQVVESDENNNAVSGSAVAVMGADLTVAAVSGPATIRTGEIVTISNTVSASAAGGDAPGTYVGLYLSTDETITTSDILIGYRIVAELGPGMTDSADTQVTIPTGIPGGTYFIGAIADVYNSVQESDEANNWLKGNAVTVVASDLTISDVSGPASGIAGSSIAVRNTALADAAGGSAGSFSLAIYLSTDTVIEATDILLGTRYIDRLDPGAVSTDNTLVTVPANLAAGTYYLGAVVDSSNSVKESNESNNAFTGNAFEIVKPDLSIVSVTGPADAKTGDTVIVTDTVSASATGAPAGSFSVAYYLSADQTITASDILLGSRQVNGLAAGDSSTAGTTLTVPLNIHGGLYYIGAIADNTNVVFESDETNNAAAGNQVTVTGPDLTITAATAPAGAFTGGTISVSTTVSASADGGASDHFSVCVYLSTDNNISSSDILLGQRMVSGLAPGTSNTADTAFSVPVDLAAATYKVGAIADCLQEVSEASENNNDFAGNEVTIMGPDLISTSVIGPSTAITGETIMISDTAAVAPTGGASTGFNVWLYLSTDNVITTSDTYLGSRYVIGLNPGESNVGSTGVTIPADLAGGVYYVGAIADPQNYVGESNETNNALAGTQITITKAYPDLVMTSASGPALANTEQQVTLTGTVKNQGQASAGAFWVSLYLSADATITSDDIWLEDVYVGGIAAGASQALNATVTIPAVLSTGTYYVGAIADRWSQADESDENNNTFNGSQMAITKVYPDLIALSAAAPGSANTEDQITVTATIKNQGQGYAESPTTGFYLSTDPVITTSDVWLGDAYSMGLAPGGEETLTGTVTIPTSVATGTYYIGVIADRTGSITESDESNNAVTGNQIAVTRLYPDLVMTSVSGPATASPRSSITVDAVVKNAGLNSAGGSYVGIYLSTDQTVNTLDTFLGQVYVSSLGTGAEQPVTLTVTLPNSRGTYYIGAIADKLNTQAESNETNNGLAGNQIAISR